MVKEIDRSSLKRRTERKLIVLGCEGKNNQTEELYFTSLERKYKNYHFVFACGKNDPVGIVKQTIEKAKRTNINLKQGDLAFSVFDVDVDRAKEKNIDSARNLAKSSKYKIDIITSNPCFEVWYLMHFASSTKPFNSSNGAINELSKYINNYSKTIDYSELLLPNTNNAIVNSEKLISYHKSFAKEKNQDYYNPCTYVHEIVKQVYDSKDYNY